MPSQLDNSYRHCEALTRSSGSNFVIAFRTLPRDMFRQMCVLYAFMRRTDDLGDEQNCTLQQRQAQLDRWKSQVEKALRGNPISDPILPALQDLVQQRQIPHEFLFEVIAGVEGDLTPRSFNDISQLEKYCYQVAGVVGLCCLKIWGDPGPQARESAIACGTAFQLTNILRDLKEDADQGRIYLPRSEMEKFGYPPEDLAAGRLTPEFRNLMEFQVARAWTFYEQAILLRELLAPPGRRIFLAFFDLYSSLLRRIELEEYDVLSRRIHLSNWKKVSVAVRCWLGCECRPQQLLRRSNFKQSELSLLTSEEPSSP